MTQHDERPPLPPMTWVPQAIDEPQPSAPTSTLPPAPRTAAGPAIGAGRLQQAVRRLTADDVKDALRIAAVSVLPVLAVLTVVIAIVTAAAMPASHSGSLADWLRTAVTVVVLAVGGSAGAAGSLHVESISEAGTLAVHAVPLAVTLALVVLAARAGIRAEQRAASSETGQLLARSGLAGLVAGLGLAVLALSASTSAPFGYQLSGQLGPFGGGVEIGPGALGAFVGGVLVIGLATAAGRLRVTRPAGRQPKWAGWVTGPDATPVLRVLRTFAAGLVAVATAALVVGFLYELLFTGNFTGKRLPAIGELLLEGVNAALALALGALGVPVGASTQVSGNSDLTSFLHLSELNQNHSWSWSVFSSSLMLLVLLVPVLVALATGVRLALRRPPADVAQQPVALGALRIAATWGAVSALVVAFLLRMSLSATFGASQAQSNPIGNIAGSGGMDAGFSLLWAPLLGAFWAALAVWLVRVGPTLALSLPPRVARLVAGRGIAPEWSAALAGTTPSPAGAHSRALRRGALFVAGLLLVGVVAGIVVAIVNSVVYKPQAEAQQYLTAVSAGNVAAALDTLAERPGVDGQPLVGARVLGSKDFTPIRDVTVGGATVKGTSATVDVSYLVGGHRYTGTLNMVQGAKRFGLFRTWKVDEGLPTVGVSSDRLAAIIGGDKLANGSYTALPGEYTFHAAADALFTAKDASVAVTGDASLSVRLSAELSGDAVRQAEDVVNARIQACEDSTALPLRNCPFMTEPSYADVQGASIQITDQPTYHLEYDQSSDQFRIVTDTWGNAHLTGTRSSTDPFSGAVSDQPVDENYDFNLDGHVSLTNGQPEVSFDY